jgi:hypothetical protein
MGLGLFGTMNVTKSRMVVLAAGLMGAVGILPVGAALPTMKEKQWLGYFVGVQNRAFQFGLTPDGKAFIKPMGKKGEPVSSKLTIPVTFKVLETMPDGKVVSRQIVPESLESAQPATDKPENIVIKGKVTGDAAFEIFVNEERGGISLGGRLVEPGNLQNPLEFSIDLRIPDVYAHAKKKTGNKKEEKAFEEKAAKDRLQLIWTDKKRVKTSLTDKVDASSKEISGPGIAAVQLELSAYDEKKLEVTASENSSIKLENRPPASLVEGFTMTWTANSGKDPQGKARLNIDMK